MPYLSRSNITRRPSFETKVSHERWLVSYADFVTLLFAFFVVMYSVSQVSETKYKMLSSMLDQTFSSSSKTPDIAAQANEQLNNEKPPVLAELTELQNEFSQALAGLVKTGEISVQGNESWVEVEVNSNLLFSSASAEPSATAKEVFFKVAAVLAPYENAVNVAGHTDNLPINNAEFGNNWALSSARAVQVVNLLALDGIAPERLSATGFGEFRPIADNTTEAGRNDNRRVVLRVAKDIAQLPKKSADDIVKGQANSQAPSIEPVTGENSGSQNTANQNADSESLQAPPDTVEPVRLKDGGLLFTSDPDLPRINR